MNRWLLEFDVRLASGPYVDRWWDDQRRRQFLLRPEVAWPLSVDSSVWPSVFFWNASKDARDEWSTIAMESLDDGLRLDTVRVRYEASRGLVPGGIFVAVEILSETPADGEVLFYEMAGGIQCGIGLDPTNPSRIPEGATLLGFDVADAGRISGLCNCGYTAEEVAQLAPVWAPRLNSSGLLTTLEDAVEFRQLSDRRVSEHAPFWIYALWRLPMG